MPPTTLTPPESATATPESEAAAVPSAAETERMPLLQMLRLFAWIGLITGFLEAGTLLARGLARGHFLWLDVQFVWMKPLGEALVILVPGVPLLVLSRFLSRKSLLFVSVGFLGFLGLFCAVSMIGGLHVLAVLVISLGLAFRAARYADAQPDRFLGFVRRTFPWMAATVFLTAAGMIVYRSVEERQAYAQLPPPPSQEAPNVLLLVMDTVRADALSVYSPDAVETPHLAEFAQHAVTFDTAFSPASWTYPSHASMFTGYYAHMLTADWDTPLSGNHPTLAEALSRGGYDTGGFVANTAYCSRPTGLDRGFVHFEDFRTDWQQVINQSQLFTKLHHTYQGLSLLGIYDNPPRKSARRVGDDFLHWLDGRPQQRPFFAFLNFLDAHDPYLPERLVDEDREMTREEKLFMKNWELVIPSQASEEMLQVARSAYRSAVHELDADLGHLFAELDRRGLRDNTIIIVTADHGEMFGEHGLCYHGNNLYRPVVHVPFMISWPGHVPAGTRVETPVTLRDLAATVLDLTDMRDQLELPGHSLRVTWDPAAAADDPRISLPYAMSSAHPAAEERPVFSESPSIRGSLHALLYDGDYLIREGDGTELLFDFENDPREERNLADTSAAKPRVERNARRLDEILESGEGTR